MFDVTYAFYILIEFAAKLKLDKTVYTAQYVAIRYNQQIEGIRHKL